MVKLGEFFFDDIQVIKTHLSLSDRTLCFEMDGALPCEGEDCRYLVRIFNWKDLKVKPAGTEWTYFDAKTFSADLLLHAGYTDRYLQLTAMTSNSEYYQLTFDNASIEVQPIKPSL
ncbi:hypothetical protein MNO19_004180 [Vibrio vulnificus]|nr:hypothetical protein [Vibrio vulnificus]